MSDPSAPAHVGTFNDRLADYLTAHAGVWIDGLTLQDVAGSYAWRSRVSDLRTDRGMVIRNRVRTLEDGSKKSEYRYEPEGFIDPDEKPETEVAPLMAAVEHGARRIVLPDEDDNPICECGHRLALHAVNKRCAAFGCVTCTGFRAKAA